VIIGSKKMKCKDIKLEDKSVVIEFDTKKDAKQVHEIMRKEWLGEK